MVYKIRNKTFFFTISGWKNNYAPKILNLPVDIKSELTFAVKNFEGGPEFIRFHQLYRNISRKCKQYLYGNKQLEEHVMNILREHFMIPQTSETPVHLIASEPLRRFLNQGDRDYELLTYNTHPYQLDLYESVNKSLQEETENNAIKESGETPLDEQIVDVLGKRLEALADKYGDNMPFEAINEAMHEVYAQYITALGAQKSRTPNGDFNDFLEVRRPFVEPAISSDNVKTA